MHALIQEVNFLPISLEKKEFVIKICFQSFSAPHLHERYQHLVKNEIINEEQIIPRGDELDEEYYSPKPQKKVKFHVDKENYKKLTKSAEKKRAILSKNFFLI